jgi:phage gpG-like protein
LKLRKKREGKQAKKPTLNKMSSIRIPARPFMKLDEQDIEKIKKNLILKLTEGK